MADRLSVHAVHDGDMRIHATTGEHTVQMDYPMGGAECSAFTPLQLLLASLAGCSGNTMALLLRRHEQAVSGIEVTASAERSDEHPTVLTGIELQILVRGTDLDEDVVRRTLVLAEDKICPVWAMLKSGTPISATLDIVQESAAVV